MKTRAAWTSSLRWDWSQKFSFSHVDQWLAAKSLVETKTCVTYLHLLDISLLTAAFNSSARSPSSRSTPSSQSFRASSRLGVTKYELQPCSMAVCFNSACNALSNIGLNYMATKLLISYSVTSITTNANCLQTYHRPPPTQVLQM